ncbi:MAG: PaaI family thioesterase [Thermomicrobiales bacterium]
MASNADLVRMREDAEAARAFEHHVAIQVDVLEAGHAVLFLDIQPFHLNSNGTLHGGVYATLIDNAMGMAVAALVGVRIATTQMNVHFLGLVKEGRVVCHGHVLHRTRRTATAEAKVYDAAGNLVGMGTGAFRIFEQQGRPIV